MTDNTPRTLEQIEAEVAARLAEETVTLEELGDRYEPIGWFGPAVLDGQRGRVVIASTYDEAISLADRLNEDDTPYSHLVWDRLRVSKAEDMA